MLTGALQQANAEKAVMASGQGAAGAGGGQPPPADGRHGKGPWRWPRAGGLPTGTAKAATLQVQHGLGPSP